MAPAAYFGSQRSLPMDLALFGTYLLACGAAAATGAMFSPGPWYDALQKAQLDPAELAVPGGLDHALPSDVRRRCPAPRRSRGRRLAWRFWSVQIALQHALDAGVLRAAADAGGAGHHGAFCGWRSPPPWSRSSSWISGPGLMFVPYLVWVTVAGALNLSVGAPEPDGRKRRLIGDQLGPPPAQRPPLPLGERVG